MADMKHDQVKHDQKQEKREDPRARLREERANRIKLISEGKGAGTVKVFAASETMRRVLRHAGGARFREQLDQGVEWPNDNFTKRRIADGSVRTESGGSADEPKVDESLNAREQTAARKPEAKSEKSELKPADRAASRPYQPPTSPTAA